jgi:RNA polymerase sigma-70 factor (ECF subfamily)
MQRACDGGDSAGGNAIGFVFAKGRAEAPVALLDEAGEEALGVLSRLESNHPYALESAQLRSMTDTDTDSSMHLLVRAREGDSVALDELITRYLPRLRRWATGRLPVGARDLLDTDDIVQDSMIATLRNLDHVEIRGEGALQAYLRQAVSNRLTDAYRRVRNRPVNDDVLSDLPAKDPSPLEEAIGHEAADRYERSLLALKSEDREAVILRIELCYGYDEIAALLGKSSAATARVAVSRALARLSHEMRNVAAV